jgi:hypothetical protein
VQEDLATLQERDPEFFAYLQQTDNDLLNFSLPPADSEAAEASLSEAEDDHEGVSAQEAPDDLGEDENAGREQPARGAYWCSASALRVGTACLAVGQIGNCST